MLFDYNTFSSSFHLGGWTLFSKWTTMDGNYTIPEISTNYDDIGNNKSLLNISVIKQLQVITQFKQLRFECFKPSVNRQLDIATIDNAKGYEVVNFFLFQNTTPPIACLTYKSLPNDNSKLGSTCSLWYYKTWARRGKNATPRQLYELPFYRYVSHYFMVGSPHFGSRWNCDDYSNTNKLGEWKYYFR